MINSGIIFGLIAMLGFGLGNAISPIAIRKIGSMASVFWRNLFTSVMFLIILLIVPFRYELSLKYIIIALLIAFIGFIPLWTFFKAQKRGKIGIINPISYSSLLFTVIFSIIFFGETLTFFQTIAILLILSGIVLSSVNFNDIKNSELFKIAHGVPFALVTMVLWGLIFALFKIPVNVLGPILTAFLIEIGVFSVSAIWFLSSKPIKMPDKKSLIIIFLVAVLGVFGLLFYNMGIQVADVSIVSAITFSSPFISVIFGKLYFKDKLRKLQYVAVMLLILGIIMISYFS